MTKHNTMLIISEWLEELLRLIPQVDSKEGIETAAGALQAIKQYCIEEAGSRNDVLIKALEQVLVTLDVCREERNAVYRVEMMMSVVQLLSEIKAVIKAVTKPKRVFFLPYKASMWDSMESIWRAACQDSACEVMVMPPPYCDRNPDGSAKEWHYEGDLFPQGVPVVHYDSVNLAELRPDMIFIHNPYDGCNIVTSVDSRFYSSELVKYTDKLIYIPYFVLDDKSAAISKERVAGFANTPGVLNAHIVVVQSDAVRDCYIEALVDSYGEETRSVWEKKIKPWGSPKFDKVHQTDLKELDIPVEWHHLLTNHAGEKKKVILYNTGLRALLQHGEVLLKKIKDTFNVFKSKKDVIALLWRPHPLIPATIGSMRPELKEQYEELVKEYLNEGWGIYDDSPDLHRAIALSDAYYGDASSVTKLFQEAGKPVMLENVDVRSSIT